MNLTTVLARPLVLTALGLAIGARPVSGAELISCRRIWDRAPHNAFTDLVRHSGVWYCVFREGSGHVSPDGAVQVLNSRDGESWASSARLSSPRGDWRDPKIVVTPDGGLQLVAAMALPQPGPVRHQTYSWFSRDGRDWGEPVAIGEPNLWLWRVTWQGRQAYGIGYDTTTERFVRLYRSENGRDFRVLVPRLAVEGSPNETSLVFGPNGGAVCLMRRDGEPGAGLVGTAAPPYTDWTWRDLGVKIGGPHLLRIPDGRWVAAVRFYDGGARTALAWLDPEAATLKEFLRLPSSGDTSYPGLVWDQGMLWVSYYSSHEGTTAIYLARVRLES